MANRSGAIGTKAETAVVRAARVRGFPHADRLRLSGTDDRGDIRLTSILEGGTIIEVKGGEMARSASENRIHGWLMEAERERVAASAAIGFVVVQRRGVGEANAHRWWAYFTMDTLRTVMVGVEGDLFEASARPGPDIPPPWPSDVLGPLDWPVRMNLEEALYLLQLYHFGSVVDEIAPYQQRN